MTKVERVMKELDAQASATVARLAALPAPAPVAERKPHPDDGREQDRASGRDYMRIKNIVPDPNQPRKHFDEDAIRQKARSMKAEGQLQPLIVEWDAELGKWLIVDGEMRWLALQAAEMNRAWCMFSQKKMTPAERLKKQLQANCLRDDFKPVERANAFKRLMDMTGCTQQQVADELHLSQASVSASLRLLELPRPIQTRIDAGEIHASVGAEIAKIADPVEQAEVANKVVAGRLNRAEAFAEAKSKTPKKKAGPKKAAKAATYSTAAGVVTVALKQPGGDEQRIALLREVLGDLEQQQREAA